jgi:cation:H+ antiporter
MLSLGSLILGLLLLVVAADKLIGVAAGIARRYNISEIIIGITLIAFGTSLPELAVSFSAIFRGNASEIVLANVIGSNIVNGLLVIGVLAIGKTILVDHTVVKREFLFNIGASLLVFIMVLDHILERNSDQLLGRIDGILLLTYFGLFAFQIIRRARISNGGRQAVLIEKSSRIKEGLLFLGLLVGVIIGGQLTIAGALGLSELFGLSQTFIGGVIIAAGTSLPELTTSVMALRRKNVDIAIGNVVGSNLFNILAILGLSATLSPIAVTSRITIDIIFLLLASILLFGLVYAKQSMHRLTPVKGFILISLYAVFLYLSFRFQ